MLIKVLKKKFKLDWDLGTIEGKFLLKGTLKVQMYGAASTEAFKEHDDKSNLKLRVVDENLRN